MAKLAKRYEARDLRTKGESVRDIAIKLSVSKGSVSLWCRDIELTSDQIQALEKKQQLSGLRGRLKGAAIQKNRRIQKIHHFREAGTKEVAAISRRELLFVGLGLFWGEGEKSSDATFGFSNSDPHAILLIIQWLEKVFNIPLDRLYFRLTVNEVYRPNVEEMLEFWYKLTEANPKQFGKTMFIRTLNKKVYKSRGMYNGVITLRVTKSSDLQRQILGLVYGLKQSKIKNTSE